MATKFEALAQGLKRYTMKKPCKRGHLGERYTSCGVCCQCSDEAMQAHQTKVKAAQRVVNAKRFEPDRVHSVIARQDHHGMFDHLAEVCAHGSAEQVEQCEAFIAMIAAQVIGQAPRKAGDLDRVELASHVNLDPAVIAYVDGSPLVDDYSERLQAPIVKIGALWYRAGDLKEVWDGRRSYARPV